MKYVLMILCACLVSVLAAAQTVTAGDQGYAGVPVTTTTSESNATPPTAAAGCKKCSGGDDTLAICGRGVTCNGAVNTTGKAAVPASGTTKAGSAEKPLKK